MLNINSERPFGIEIECFIPDMINNWHCLTHGIARGHRPPERPCQIIRGNEVASHDIDEQLCVYQNNREYQIQDSEYRSTGTSAQQELGRYLIANTPYHFESQGYNHQTVDYWKIIYDGSLNSHQREVPDMVDKPWFWATELVSPKLYGNKGLTETTSTIECLQKSGAYINKQCSLHVHHDAKYLSLAGLSKLIEFYILYEGVIDSILPKSRRGTNNRWAQSMHKYTQSKSKNVRKKLAKHKMDYKEYTDPNLIITNFNHYRTEEKYRIKYPACDIYGRNVNNYVLPERDFSTSHKSRFARKALNGDRYKKLNLSTNYNTVEFRHHSGSTDKNKILNWIALTSKIMDFCSHAKTTLKEDTEPSLENMAELLRLEASNYTYYSNRQQHFLNTYGDIYEECAALPPRPKKKKVRKQPKQPSLKIRHKKA